MKTAFVYFSYSNNTKKLVEGIEEKYPFDCYRIERKMPYSSDYDTCAYHEAKEEYEKEIHPEIKDIFTDFTSYDRILLFFPIWWYTIPMSVATFVEKNLKGYQGKVELFANSYTNDPQYMKNSEKDLKRIAPDITFKVGLFNRSLKDHLNYLNKEEK